MPSNAFFDESREQSLVKATIVEKYFDAWASIIIATQKRQSAKAQKIGYVDLFAGPGRYKDGAVSTPLRIVQRAIEKNDYRERLVTIFNDKDEENVRTLDDAFASLAGIETLQNKPIIWNAEVGSAISQQFEKINTIPILAFIDPWGYKGLTLQLVNAFLKDWGCDCLFFFNYGRINAGLSNPLVQTHMAALFGEARARELSSSLEGMPPRAREATIVEALAMALSEHGHRFVLPFCFKNASGQRTSHHLILVTKHFKGYEVMKDIMAKSSSGQEQGVPSFSYCPADSEGQRLLFELNRPIDDLADVLMRDFSGRSVSMRALYEQHSVGKPFLSRHYKEALRLLEHEERIKTSGRKSTRGFADDIVCQFPEDSPRSP